MPSQQFEPFQDRLSRDIRNDLSEAFADAVAQGTLAAATRVAARFRRVELAPCYEAYIADRLERYERALTRFGQGPDDVLWKGLVLWDLQLFFEVHEILEHAWLEVGGAEKELLQAMIRAAGVYIKLRHGYDDAAKRIAAKAQPVLEKHRQRLAAYTDPDRLIRAMEGPDPDPPLLLPADG